MSTADPHLSQMADADLVALLRDGNEDAATELYNRYLIKLMNLVGQHLARKFNPRLGAEDVVQSVFRSMFRLTQEGRFEFEGDGDFWKLLLTMALNKVRNKVRFHEAEKRSPSRESGSTSSPAVDSFLVSSITKQPLNPQEIVEFSDTLEYVLSRLDAREQQLIQLRMDGCTQQEIADKMNVDPRTIRRLLTNIRDRTAELLDDTD